jgi:signal peptidase I
MNVPKYITSSIAVILFIFGLVFVVSVFPVFGGGVKILAVLSGSMEPAIQTGSLIAIRPAQEYAVGDIVTFGQAGSGRISTTHRIVEVKNSGMFVTKGDANQSRDGKEVLAGEIQGRVFITIPYAGYMVHAVRNPIGFLLVIILPALYIIGDEVKNIYKESRKL